MDERVFVFDTSAIVGVKQQFPRDERSRLWKGLDERAERGGIVFPRAVMKELRDGNTPGRPDEPLEWAERNETACDKSNLDDEIREMFAAFPAVQRVLDRDKDEGEDEADPYVLALARKLQEEGCVVTVVTEEKKTRPDKMAMKDACGIMGIPALSVDAYLRLEGLVS